MRRKASFLFGIFLSLLILGSYLPLHDVANAASEFKTTYNTSYVISEDGNTKVTQNVTVENLTSQYFVSQYKFTIGSESITNVTAWDPTGSLTPKIEKSNGETKITLNFRARIVGKGNKLNFGISYNFPNLATKNGLIWEIDLLKISGLEKISSYNLTVSVPTSFGPSLFQFPTPLTQKIENQRRIITYDKNALLKGAPRLGFGEFQIYKLSLTYHLNNTRIGFGYTEIALPPDILGYQQEIQENLFPAPTSIRVDGDGNYLARYDLRPLEKKDVVWEGFLILFYPQREFSTEKAGALPTELIQNYTGAQKYWETQALEIKAEAARLVDPKSPVSQNASRIYNFVTNKLSYDYQKLESGNLIRLGALASLSQSTKAVCMEYTDLTIALARAGGIPAREIDGYAYTSDNTNRPLSLRIEQGDVLHAWLQIYLPKIGWMMVDPTWGSTSGSNYFSAFDLSHLAFVIKGASSEYPLPAGSYKTDPSQKDVSVSFSSETTVKEENPKLDITVIFPTFAVSPLPVDTTISATNRGKTTAFGTHITLESNILALDQSTLELGTIPPGATVSRTVRLSPQNALTQGEEHLLASASAKEFDGNTLTFQNSATKTVRPIYLPLSWMEFGILVLGLATTFLGRRLLLTRLLEKKQKLNGGGVEGTKTQIQQ